MRVLTKCAQHKNQKQRKDVRRHIIPTLRLAAARGTLAILSTLQLYEQLSRREGRPRRICADRDIMLAQLGNHSGVARTSDVLDRRRTSCHLYRKRLLFQQASLRLLLLQSKVSSARRFPLGLAVV